MILQKMHAAADMVNSVLRSCKGMSMTVELFRRTVFGSRPCFGGGMEGDNEVIRVLLINIIYTIIGTSWL